MAENKNRSRSGPRDNQKIRSDDSSIGNQQKTTQTGAQNAGGQNIDQREDRYTDDLRRSGDRSSSNRKENG